MSDAAPTAASGEAGMGAGRKKVVIRRKTDSNVTGELGAVPSISPQRPPMLQAIGSDDEGSGDKNKNGSAQMESASQKQQPCPELDRMLFSSIHFSAPSFVNNIANRVLLPILTSKRKKAAASGVKRQIVENGGNSNNNTDAKQLPDEAVDADDYVYIASRLTRSLESALCQMEKLQDMEERSLQATEVRCRRVEIREKRQLATIRLGLEATTARLHEYENRVCNALAATAGIEQHLSQSNARVMRGRSVSELLKHFRMLTKMNHVELHTVLKNLSKARVEQRDQVKAQWEAGAVKSADPMYYGGDDAAVGADDSHTKGNEHHEAGNEEGGGNKNQKHDRPHESSRQRGGSRQLRRRVVIPAHVDDGVGSGDKMHRLETAAVAAGLDRTFAVRSCTEAQVDWCQRLSCLRRELDGVVPNTANIDMYLDWLRQEIVADVFHLVESFNELYKEHSERAVHQVYGRAILKTLEFVSRLYTTITPSHDALLSVFYSRTINQMGVTLFSEYSPKPLPAQPLFGDKTTTTSVSVMEHYHSTTEPDLQRTFGFLISSARRDVIIVETIFGTTNSARQQLFSQITEGVVKPFLTQQLKLVEFFERDIVEAEARLSPRSKRRAAVRIVEAITYAHVMQVRLFGFFEAYVEELRHIFDRGEVDFLNKYTNSIFTSRAAFSERRAELELLRRHHTLLEEQYTRDLHPVPDEVFDLREAHMKKTKEIIERFAEVVTRTRAYTLPKDVGSCVLDLVKVSFEKMGHYLDGELRKTIDSIRADRGNWRIKPRSEDELLLPNKPESQQCGLRMLLFAQSSVMQLDDVISGSCGPLLQNDTHLASSIEEERDAAFEVLDERAETLLNLCANAIIVRSLSILQHYQNRNDYMPKVTKGTEGEMLAQPCTRACTLFCLYITRQFEEAKEFIRLSNGQVPQRQTASQVANGARLEHIAGSAQCASPLSARCGLAPAKDVDVSDAVKARARQMNMRQLLYGDGGPSSFVRTIGVCLYQGITTHLKAFTVTDRGALIYKQDVTAYMEAMGPIIHTPGLGGAVVGVLFSLLKETASLLLMPWDHIKGVRDTGLLRLMSNEEKVEFIKMREDLREGFRRIAD